MSYKKKKKRKRPRGYKLKVRKSCTKINCESDIFKLNVEDSNIINILWNNLEVKKVFIKTIPSSIQLLLNIPKRYK